MPPGCPSCWEVHSQGGWAQMNPTPPVSGAERQGGDPAAGRWGQHRKAVGLRVSPQLFPGGHSQDTQQPPSSDRTEGLLKTIYSERFAISLQLFELQEKATYLRELSQKNQGGEPVCTDWTPAGATCRPHRTPSCCCIHLLGSMVLGFFCCCHY